MNQESPREGDIHSTSPMVETTADIVSSMSPDHPQAPQSSAPPSSSMTTQLARKPIRPSTDEEYEHTRIAYGLIESRSQTQNQQSSRPNWQLPRNDFWGCRCPIPQRFPAQISNRLPNKVRKFYLAINAAYTESVQQLHARFPGIHSFYVHFIARINAILYEQENSTTPTFSKFYFRMPCPWPRIIELHRSDPYLQGNDYIGKLQPPPVMFPSFFELVNTTQATYDKRPPSFLRPTMNNAYPLQNPVTIKLVLNRIYTVTFPTRVFSTAPLDIASQFIDASGMSYSQLLVATEAHAIDTNGQIITILDPAQISKVHIRVEIAFTFQEAISRSLMGRLHRWFSFQWPSHIIHWENYFINALGLCKRQSIPPQLVTLSPQNITIFQMLSSAATTFNPFIQSCLADIIESTRNPALWIALHPHKPPVEDNIRSQQLNAYLPPRQRDDRLPAVYDFDQSVISAAFVPQFHHDTAFLQQCPESQLRILMQFSPQPESLRPDQRTTAPVQQSQAPVTALTSPTHVQPTQLHTVPRQLPPFSYDHGVHSLNTVLSSLTTLHHVDRLKTAARDINWATEFVTCQYPHIPLTATVLSGSQRYTRDPFNSDTDELPILPRLTSFPSIVHLFAAAFCSRRRFAIVRIRYNVPRNLPVEYLIPQILLNNGCFSVAIPTTLFTIIDNALHSDIAYGTTEPGRSLVRYLSDQNDLRQPTVLEPKPRILWAHQSQFPPDSDVFTLLTPMVHSSDTEMNYITAHINDDASISIGLVNSVVTNDLTYYYTSHVAQPVGDLFLADDTRFRFVKNVTTHMELATAFPVKTTENSEASIARAWLTARFSTVTPFRRYLHSHHNGCIDEINKKQILTPFPFSFTQPDRDGTPAAKRRRTTGT